MRPMMAVRLVILLLAMGMLGCAAKQVVKPPNAKVRIGVYDSRAIAIAWVGTESFNKWMMTFQTEFEKAKAAGDQKRIKELEAEAVARQQHMHMQGFSTAPVDEILKNIEGSLPGIKEKAGVTMLVSKWDKGTLANYSSAEIVDVTLMLVDILQPNERQRKWAMEIMEKEPIPLEEAEKIKDW